MEESSQSDCKEFRIIKLGALEIKDSLQFLNSSLEKMANNLKDKGLKEGKSIKDTFPNTYAYLKKKFIKILMNKHLNC